MTSSHKAFLFLLWVGITPLFAQEDASEVLQAFHDQDNFQQIVLEHAPKAEGYNAHSQYLVGLAFFNMSKDIQALKWTLKALEQDAEHADANYISGMAYAYLGQIANGQPYLEKATLLEPGNPTYWSGLGDIHFNLKEWEEALTAYQNSTRIEGGPDRPFFMIPQTYNHLGQNEKMVEWSYKARERVVKQGDSYINLLYNLGMFESLHRNFEKAEPVFAELLELTPDDYRAMAKMVQVYYGLGQYDKAEPWREKIYQARKAEKVPPEMMQNFCFDQFPMGAKKVMAFENYEEPEDKLYYKHLFFLVDENGQQIGRVQTESNPVFAELGDTKYVLGQDIGNRHETYNFAFTADFDYGMMKKAVIQILKGEAKPGASSEPTK